MNLRYPDTYAEIISSKLFPNIVGMGIQGLVALHDNKYAVKLFTLIIYIPVTEQF